MTQNAALNSAVTGFVDGLELPLTAEIHQLRKNVLAAHPNLAENVKWNGPNYCFKEKDRITMRIQPPGKIQLVFHCGAKVQAQPKTKLIDDTSGLLEWKANDRAVANFKTMADINANKTALTNIIHAWLAASNQ